jgi:hypothetical protein
VDREAVPIVLLAATTFVAGCATKRIAWEKAGVAQVERSETNACLGGWAATAASLVPGLHDRTSTPGAWKVGILLIPVTRSRFALPARPPLGAERALRLPA